MHHCPECKYITDRDVASGQVIRNRGLTLISTPGHGGMETVCAVGLPGAEETPTRLEAKRAQGNNQKSQEVILGSLHCTACNQCRRMSL